MPRAVAPAKPKAVKPKAMPAPQSKPTAEVKAKPKAATRTKFVEPRSTVESPKTVADLMRSLGDIPASRIRLDAPPGKATEADVLRILDRENRVCEIVEGTLVEKAMGNEEGRVTFELTYLLAGFLRQHDIGVANGPDGTLRLTTGLLRIPDISFISWDRLPGGQYPAEPVPWLALDLAIEILSRSNSKREMSRKVREYFEAGMRLVWLIDPRKRIARIFTSPTEMTLLKEDDSLDGGDILPGFRLVLRDLFDAANRSRRR